MSLTTEEIALLHEIVKWRRTNGWRHERAKYADCRHDWIHDGNRAQVLVDVFERGDVETTVFRSDGALAHGGWPTSVREAVDVMCALSVLPARFSSAYWIGQGAAAVAVAVAVEAGTAAAEREAASNA